MFRLFLNDRRGATVVEYALIAGILSLGIIAGMPPLANSMSGLLGDSGSALNQALNR